MITINLCQILFPTILFHPNNHLQNLIDAILFLGTLTITSTGSQVIGEKLVLTCTLSPFNGTASWLQDGAVHTICASSFCTISRYGNFTFSFASNHIDVTFEHVDSSINGVWECTHSELGSANVTLTAMNETLSKYSLIN
jgi:hypothetical protein